MAMYRQPLVTDGHLGHLDIPWTSKKTPSGHQAHGHLDMPEGPRSTLISLRSSQASQVMAGHPLVILAVPRVEGNDNTLWTEADVNSNES